MMTLKIIILIACQEKSVVLYVHIFPDCQNVAQ